jgi:hypothetical protein
MYSEFSNMRDAFFPVEAKEDWLNPRDELEYLRQQTRTGKRLTQSDNSDLYSHNPAPPLSMLKDPDYTFGKVKLYVAERFADFNQQWIKDRKQAMDWIKTDLLVYADAPMQADRDQAIQVTDAKTKQTRWVYVVEAGKQTAKGKARKSTYAVLRSKSLV